MMWVIPTALTVAALWGLSGPGGGLMGSERQWLGMFMAFGALIAWAMLGLSWL